MPALQRDAQWSSIDTTDAHFAGMCRSPLRACQKQEAPDCPLRIVSFARLDPGGLSLFPS